MSHEKGLHLRLFNKADLLNRSRSANTGAGRLPLPVLRKLAPGDTALREKQIQPESSTKTL